MGRWYSSLLDYKLLYYPVSATARNKYKISWLTTVNVYFSFLGLKVDCGLAGLTRVIWSSQKCPMLSYSGVQLEGSGSLWIMDDTWSLCTLGQFTSHWCGYTKWPLYLENKKRLRKEADHSRSVDGRVNKQGNLYRRLVIGGCKMSRSPYLPIAS